MASVLCLIAECMCVKYPSQDIESMLGHLFGH